MGQAQQKRRAVLIVEDDAELRSLTAALFEDEQVDTIECESAEAALATLLIGGREVAMIFADVRLRGVMDRIDLAREVKMRWPLLPVILNRWANLTTGTMGRFGDRNFGTTSVSIFEKFRNQELGNFVTTLRSARRATDLYAALSSRITEPASNQKIQFKCFT